MRLRWGEESTAANWIWESSCRSRGAAALGRGLKPELLTSGVALARRVAGDLRLKGSGVLTGEFVREALLVVRLEDGGGSLGRLNSSTDSTKIGS